MVACPSRRDKGGYGAGHPDPVPQRLFRVGGGEDRLDLLLRYAECAGQPGKRGTAFGEFAYPPLIDQGRITTRVALFAHHILAAGGAVALGGGGMGIACGGGR